MELMETLQELILAAKADGDDDTAEWLASVAEDPEQIVELAKQEDAEDPKA